MKSSRTAIWRLVILLCIITLPACQFRAQRNQEASPTPTPVPALATPTPVPAVATPTPVPALATRTPVLALATPTPVPALVTPTIRSSPTLAPASADPTGVPLRFVTGRNDYVINVDNTPRKFIVYVPKGYDPQRPTAIVVMCHGSNQSGNVMYENTGWVAKAEKENLIVAFPSSWQYFLITDNRVEEKWNIPGIAELTKPGTELKDDVHFMRVMLDQLKATFNVDKKRIFASGFSNGGFFVVSRLMGQMNDVFAAFATGGVGPLGEKGVIETTAKTNTSLYEVFGTLDQVAAEGTGLPLPFPFKAEEIVNHPNFRSMLLLVTTGLGLNMSYTVQSEPEFTTLTFDKSLVGADNEFRFRMVRGMLHVYPSGDNNRAGLNASDLFWDFFVRHSKP